MTLYCGSVRVATLCGYDIKVSPALSWLGVGRGRGVRSGTLGLTYGCIDVVSQFPYQDAVTSQGSIGGCGVR